MIIARKSTKVNIFNNTCSFDFIIEESMFLWGFTF